MAKKTHFLCVAVGLSAAFLVGVAIIPLLLPWPSGGALAGWSNYGQTFGVVNGFFAALAFVAALYTVLLQRELIAQSNAHNERVMDRIQEQVRAMEQTAKIHALAAILHTCERYRMMNVLGQQNELDDLARKAMNRLKESLNL